MKTLILPFLLLLTFCISCSPDIEETLKKNIASYDVYVAGKENNKACYWKNTIKTILVAGNGLEAGEIVIDNSDMYVLGYQHDFVNGVTNSCYWKNNVKYDIQQILGLQTSDDFHFKDIIFKSGNVYILGTIKNPASISINDAYHLCYWKNGVKTTLENQPLYFPNSFIEKMYFHNNNLYITSYKNYDPGNSTVDFGYYKNGNYNFISNSNYRTFKQFFIDGSSLNIITEGSNPSLEIYNTTSSTFSSFFIPNISYLYSAVKDGSDIYLNVGGAYYKNGTLITLPTNTNGYVVSLDFKVLDGNIYLLRQKDSEGILGQKVYINNIETQSIISNNTGDKFNSITVMPQ